MYNQPNDQESTFKQFLCAVINFYSLSHFELFTVKTEAKEGAAGSSVNPYIGFRRRTEKMQTRKNRKNDEDSYIRMLKLRRDLNRSVMLLEMVKRREQMKKERLALTADLFEKQFQAEDWDSALLQQVPQITSHQQSLSICAGAGADEGPGAQAVGDNPTHALGELANRADDPAQEGETCLQVSLGCASKKQLKLTS